MCGQGAAVVEDVGGLASRILQRIRENLHRGEVARIVHLPSERARCPSATEEKLTGRNGLPKMSRMNDDILREAWL